MNFDKVIIPAVRDMKPSGIRKFFDVASQIEGAISLGVGEPDFSTPWKASEYGIYSIEKGKTQYTSNSGMLELRQEITKYLSKYSLSYSPTTEILVTVGASEAIDLALRAIISPGDEVIYHEPCYVSYKPIIELCGGVAVTIETEDKDDFKITKKQLEEKLSEKTKAVLISFPNNPTGAIMKKEDLESIAELLRGKDILVISDEIYSELTYNDEHFSIAAIEGMQEQTLVINGFSKAYAMTGWRLGYAAGPEILIEQMTKIHQFTIMCAGTAAQYCGLEALRSCDEDVKRMVQEYRRRRNYMVTRFNEMGLSCKEPGGAFYCFTSIESTGLSSEEFCERLLYAKKVAVVPGTACGISGEGFIRCSYAYSVEEIKNALDRIEEFIKSLGKGIKK